MSIDRIWRQVIMSATARLDLKLEQDEKDTVARAAAIMGTTVAAFVRLAAKEKASDVIEREHRVTMSAVDFRAFSKAINQPFVPNAALLKGMQLARAVKRA
jgi:uncharacterized protein (DUF1778 family)